MIFKQDNIISSEYILYVLGITFILLLATYLILFFFKKKIVSKFELNSGINHKLEVQKLSSKTTLYIYDKIDYDVIIVESDQKVSVMHVSKCTENKVPNDEQSTNV
ncbi:MULTISPECIES: hypothetical protein [Acinetobacter calcoaceticus/baumannii complex]|uniref:Uncharacterized protein n=1 Tax=Acinetobacter pittii TaxID=48296 RepID=A0A6H0FW80_ACIPI|nr:MULTISPECIES: hypothetical protein [Acinetobacter calcoaceticus/baumannii complex]MDH2549178.1 hypothetical protein [Acinetobacter baumannii]MDH2643941.1 hypothetical protein [Acinetobacter baumannii]MDQ9890662.1 hypothetical protein [Acinetobacter pittii]MDV7634497.1 hypothetical protein [Acinetobacter baumannii]MDV7648843.1 hypothetical protein [Acinetobacter baumannii]